jgi:hypothetical protein
MDVAQELTCLGNGAAQDAHIEEAITIYSGREVMDPQTGPGQQIAPRQPGAGGTLTHETRSRSGFERSG